MEPKFGKLIEGWMAVPLKSGLIFWTGGFVAWLWHVGWARVWQEAAATNPSPMQVSLVAFGVLLVMATAISLLNHFCLLVLRFLEGYYWPPWLKRLMIKLENWSWINKSKERFQILENKGPKSRTRKEHEEFARLDKLLM